MECIERCAGGNTDFNEDVLKNIHYFSAYRDDQGRVCTFSVPDRFNDVHFYWAVYEGHVYFRWWLSKYFEVFLQHLKSCDNGSSLEEFFAMIDPNEFNDTVAHFCGSQKDFYGETMKAVLGLFRGPSALPDACSEEMLMIDEARETPSCLLAKFVLMMATYM